jgi:hypothetical protein
MNRPFFSFFPLFSLAKLGWGSCNDDRVRLLRRPLFRNTLIKIFTKKMFPAADFILPPYPVWLRRSLDLTGAISVTGFGCSYKIIIFTGGN